jgi:leucyl aminopeptidase
MTDAYIIETATLTAGIVAAQGRGFRFYASHPSMFVLEGEIFDSLKAAQKACEKIARMPRQEQGKPQAGARRWGFSPDEYAEAS